MRIIGGRLQGIFLRPPKALPVRPTTGLAKEGLFNILNNRLDFEQIHVLDLFSGTGSISLEFASRGTPRILAVDRHPACYRYLKTMIAQYNLTSIQPFKTEVFKFLSKQTQAFDLIFADPPYDIPQLFDLPSIILNRHLIKAGGSFILEHSSTKTLKFHPNFKEQRKYGSSTFSFFESIL